MRLHGEVGARSHIHETMSVGDRVADAMANGMGSWFFLIAQTLVVLIWVIGNAISKHGFDPYPFILLNLMFSTQASYTGPILLKANNRQASKDRVRDDQEAREVELLYQMNQRQIEMLEKQQEEIALLRAMLDPKALTDSIAKHMAKNSVLKAPDNHRGIF